VILSHRIRTIAILFSFEMALGIPSVTSGELADFNLDAKAATGAELDKLREEFDFALTGLQASREKIRRGQYSLEEHRIEEAGGKLSSIDITYSTSFDDDEGLFRTEFEQTAPLPQPNRFIYINRPEESYFWNRQGSFSTMQPGYLDNHASPPVDVRTLGTGLYYDYVARGQFGENGIASLKAVLLKSAELIDVNRQGDIVALHYFSNANHSSRFQLLLDESRDFVPVRVESIVFDSGKNEWREDQSTETTWKLVGDCWMPETLRSVLPIPQRELELKFRWLSVNKPLDESLFTKESLALPDGTYISNYTLTPNKGILEKIVGEPDKIDRVISTNNWSLGRKLLIVVNLVAVAVLFSVIVYRRRRATNATS